MSFPNLNFNYATNCFYVYQNSNSNEMTFFSRLSLKLSVCRRFAFTEINISNCLRVDMALKSFPRIVKVKTFQGVLQQLFILSIKKNIFELTLHLFKYDQFSAYSYQCFNLMLYHMLFSLQMIIVDHVTFYPQNKVKYKHLLYVKYFFSVI